MPTLKFKPLRLKKIAITTGDPSGVGFEVSAKALSLLNPQKHTIFFLFRDHDQEKKQSRYFKLIDTKWTRITFFSLDVALDFVNSIEKTGQIEASYLIDLSLRITAADWVVTAAKACLEKKLDGLVTGPLSKTLVVSSGFKELGHTGYFGPCARKPRYIWLS